MSKKTLIGCGLLLLGMVGLFTALPYAEAEPLISGATREVTVTATIPEYAEASLGGDIVITRFGNMGVGMTELTVAANYPYVVDAHWLTGHLWETYYTEVGISDIDNPSAGGWQQGTLSVIVIFTDTTPSTNVGDDAGDAHGEADVYYDDVEVGVVQVTVSHQP
ncbi:MAG: hypothetical protein KAW89_08005 [Armatimonadetes bacterium]|nr:hypothetical protein [Armatimonadota bacterium]